MIRRGFTAVLITIIVLVILLFPATAYTQTSFTISSYSIESEDGGDVTDNPLMAGLTYTVSFEVTLDATLDGTTLRISTPLSKVGDVYWRLVNEYTGVNTNIWQPGQDSIQFDAIKGVAQFTCTGRVPSTYTTEELTNGDTLHFTSPISVVSLSLSGSGELLDEIETEVKDETIIAYQNLLSNKQSLLQVTGADPTYHTLAEDIVTLSEQLSEKGYVEGANSLLAILPDQEGDFPTIEELESDITEKSNLVASVDTDSSYANLVNDIISLAEVLGDEGYVNIADQLLDNLPDSAADFPEPASEQSSVPYLVVIIVLALITVAGFVLFMRAKSNNSFIQQQVEEEAGRLDVLLVRISKIDKQLANDISQVKEQLERISGR